MREHRQRDIQLALTLEGIQKRYQLDREESERHIMLQDRDTLQAPPERPQDNHEPPRP